MSTDTRSLLATARRLAGEGDTAGAARALAAVSENEDLAAWVSADRRLAKLDPTWARRRVRVAVLSSHTSAQLTAAIRVAAAAHGIAAETYESDYRLYEQEVLDPSSGLYSFEPDVVVIVADQRELHLPELSGTPDDDVAAEVSRWGGTWNLVRERTGAVVVQTSFVEPLDDALGNLGAFLPGGRRHQIRRLNLALAVARGPGVHLVDAEAVAAGVGEQSWADARYWYLSKHAVGLAAVPSLARAITDVLAAALGLSRKVIAVDLDNTLWGGVIGEDGLGGIVLGDGAAGEAYVDFQRFLKALRQRGLVLVAVSKNNAAEALLPFEQHPDMVLGVDDFVAFEASWDDKSDVLTRIANTLGLGLDAFVFVDDNPVEREGVRARLPEVGVVELPRDATGYVHALATFPGLQTVAITDEDRRRTEQYRARREAGAMEAQAGDRGEFLAGLQMSCVVEPMSEVNRRRMVQLIGKTNQFNLTGARLGDAELDDILARGGMVWGQRVSDRFDDHGLVAVLAASASQDVPDDLVIDTWVMSCRVLQRTAEFALLAHLAQEARRRGFCRIVGTWVPSGRNVPARSVFEDAGFTLAEGGGEEETAVWVLDLATGSVEDPGHVPVQSPVTV